jgi:hypothetical protein
MEGRLNNGNMEGLTIDKYCFELTMGTSRASPSFRKTLQAAGIIPRADVSILDLEHRHVSPSLFGTQTWRTSAAFSGRIGPPAQAKPGERTVGQPRRARDAADKVSGPCCAALGTYALASAPNLKGRHLEALERGPQNRIDESL